MAHSELWHASQMHRSAGELHDVAEWAHQAGITEQSAASLPVVRGSSDESALVNACATLARLTHRDAPGVCGPFHQDPPEYVEPETVSQFAPLAHELDHERWMRVCTAIRDELAERADEPRDPAALLSAASEPLTQTVSQLRTAVDSAQPTLLSGPVAYVAAVLLATTQPDTTRYLRPIQYGSYLVEHLAIEHLAVTPVLVLHIADDLHPAAIELLPDLARQTIQVAINLA